MSAKKEKANRDVHNSAPNTQSSEALSTQPSASDSGSSKNLPVEFGRYRLLKQLGVGGMGAVYLAHDTQLERQVALKLPHFGKTNVTQIERFRREARLSAKLEHPNICQVYDIDEHQGRLFLTMAYIQGNTLHETIRAKGAVTPRIAVNLVRGIAKAVHFAHEQGIIHRDLKPANIMIKKNQQFVIMDFGLARRIERDDEQVTVAGTVLGTPVYMAPEQLRGENDAIGPHSDVYSLGIILYELLVGERPFQGTLPQIYAQVLASNSVSPGLEHGIDPGLCAICRKATHSDVSRRYVSAAELASELGNYLSRLVSASSVSAPSSPLSSKYVNATPISPAPMDSSHESLNAPQRIDQQFGTRIGNSRLSGSTKLIAFSLLGLLALISTVLLGWRLKTQAWSPDFQQVPKMLDSLAGGPSTGTASEAGAKGPDKPLDGSIDASVREPVVDDPAPPSSQTVSASTAPAVSSTQPQMANNPSSSQDVAGEGESFQTAADGSRIVPSLIPSAATSKPQPSPSPPVEKQLPIEQTSSEATPEKSIGGGPSRSVSPTDNLPTQVDRHAKARADSDRAAQRVVQEVSQLLEDEQALSKSFAEVQEQLGAKQQEAVQFATQLQVYKNNMAVRNEKIATLGSVISALRFELSKSNLTDAERLASSNAMANSQGQLNVLNAEVQVLFDRARLLDNSIQMKQLEIAELEKKKVAHYQKLQEMVATMNNPFLSAYSYFPRTQASELLKRSSYQRYPDALFAKLVQGYASLHLEEFEKAKKLFADLLKSTQSTGPELIYRLTQVGYARTGLALKSTHSLRAVPAIADMSEVRKGTSVDRHIPIVQAIEYEWLLCQGEYLVLLNKSESALRAFSQASKKLPGRCDAYRLQADTMIAMYLKAPVTDKTLDTLRLAEQAVQLGSSTDIRNKVTLAKAQLLARQTEDYHTTRAAALEMAESQSKERIILELDSHFQKLSLRKN